MSPTLIAGYIALFTALGIAFLFGNLLLGRLLRPNNPSVEKLEIYECGEPTIGSSFVQFDLRFYVVALLFLIFDVEVALFFPWAMVFGKTTQLADVRLHESAYYQGDEAGPGRAVAGLYRDLGLSETYANASPETIQASSARLAWISFADIGVFFAVLVVGFLYVWKRGDLDWVRTVSRERAKTGTRTPLAA